MPEIGEVKQAKAIGKKGDPFRKFRWVSCPECGTDRWSSVRNVAAITVCYPCSMKYRQGENNANWRGGRYKIWSGYIMVTLKPDDFFYSMCNHGHVQEHRLIIAKYLNRCLLPWEVVHHKNGIKDDNRLENLQLLPTQTYHVVDTQVKQYIRKLENHIRVLETKLVKAGGAIPGIRIWQEDTIMVKTR